MSAIDALNDSSQRAASYLSKASRRAGAAAPAVFAGGGLTATAAAMVTRDASARQVQHAGGWVYAAVRPTAQRIAGQPVRLARLGNSSDIRLPNAQVSHQPHVHKDYLPGHLKSLAPTLQHVTSHPFLDTMNRPNDIMVRWSLLYFLVASLEITGRAFWWVTTGKDGKRSVWPIPSAWMSANHDARLFSSWTVRPPGAGGDYKLDSSEVVYFSYPDHNDPLGSTSPLQMQAKAVSADEAIQTAQERAFKNGLFPGVVITVGKQQEVPGVMSRPRLTPDQRRDIVAMLKAMYRGVLKSDEPLILDALIENVHKISNTPREMDFLQSSKWTKARIFQGYGVNQFIAGELEGANRAVAVVADANHGDYVVNPKLEMISQVLTTFMLPMFDADSSLVAYVEPVRPNDPEMKLKESELLTKSGALLRDELRAMYGMPPLPNGAGQSVILMPGQAIVPAETAVHDGTATLPQADKPPASPNKKPPREPMA
jgi:phage portal protein BeeE